MFHWNHNAYCGFRRRGRMGPCQRARRGRSLNSGTGDSQCVMPTRCLSGDAASVIKQSSAEDNLLIITSDASGRGGGSKHDGLASVLRIRNGVSKMPFQNRVSYQDGAVDLIDTIARRRIPSRTDSNEVAAISLGMKRAMQIVPQAWRKKVMIVSDSEVALRFYCGERGSSSGGEYHRRILTRLMNESPNGVFFTKIRSSSRGIGTVSWDGIGFIDHDGADHLASITRSKPNSKFDMSLGRSLELEKLPFRAVRPLRHEDIEWLENSDDEVKLEPKNESGDSIKYWKKITVRGSEARNEQKKRSERKQKMIMDMLGIGDI
jgi:hypothetical protein